MHEDLDSARAAMKGVLASASLAAALLLGAGAAGAQTTQTAVCSNTPDSTVISGGTDTVNRIECVEPATKAGETNTDAIDLDLDKVTIVTTTSEKTGIGAVHRGAGDIDISFTNGSITTSGVSAFGIEADHTGTGDLTVDVRDSTLSTGERGVSADGHTNVDVSVSDTGITTTDFLGAGVFGQVRGTGDLTIDLDDATVMTSGEQASGVQGYFGFDAAADTGMIDIDIDGGSITTSGTDAPGVYARHHYAGDIDITLRNTSVTTTGSGADVAPSGIFSWNYGSGNNAISLTNTRISTSAYLGHGIYGQIYDGGDGGSVDVSESDLRISVTGGAITTNNINAHGVFSYTTGNALEIRLNNVDITTESAVVDPNIGDYTAAAGVYGRHVGNGILDIEARGGSITTKGKFSYGIRARHEGTGYIGDTTDIVVRTLSGQSITTTGQFGHGIVARHQAVWGDAADTDMRRIDITVGGPITVSGARARGVLVGNVATGVTEHVAALDADGNLMQTVTVNGRITSTAEGVFLAGGGRVIIGRRGSINSGSGIAILATGKTAATTADQPQDDFGFVLPRLRVDLNLGGRRVAQALGENGWILNDGGETTIAMNNVVLHDGTTGVTGRTATNGAWNVRMRAEGVTVTDRTDPDPANWVVSEAAEGVITDRDFSTADFTEVRRPSPPPPPPPEPEMHRVDEPVVADASAMAGVHVEGDGAVHIGAQGSITAASGIAILATGDDPDLLVDMDLNGRQVGEVIGDDWIINDGGGTTIVVNGVTLHDGTTGVVPGASAPNGAREVRMQAQAGTGRTGADADAVRIREAGVRVLDRTDPDPANWVVSEPAEGVIADRDFSAADFISGQEGAEPQPPGFVEEYAPRAALYEALPDFLLRLTGPGPNRRCRSAPEERAWVRFAGGQGAYAADRTTTGATYTLDRFETEGGFSAAVNDRVRGWVSVRHLWGTAGVGSPTGGGTIDVRGLGASVGGAWQSPTGAYALGCFAYMRYNVDFASTHRGLLKAGTNARANTLDVETGWRVALTEQVHLTPRVWVVGSRVAVDRFTDAVAARVAYADAARVLGGLGVLADTTRPWGEGAFTLRGSVDLEKLLSGRETRVAVSGESLRATATAHSLLVGLNGVYRQGRFSIGAEVAARQELGSADSEYASFLNLGVRW